MPVAIRAAVLRPVVGGVGREATNDEKEHGTDYSRASSIRREEALLSLSLVTSAATHVRLTHTIGGRWIHLWESRGRKPKRTSDTLKTNKGASLGSKPQHCSRWLAPEQTEESVTAVEQQRKRASFISNGLLSLFFRRLHHSLNPSPMFKRHSLQTNDSNSSDVHREPQRGHRDCRPTTKRQEYKTTNTAKP